MSAQTSAGTDPGGCLTLVGTIRVTNMNASGARATSGTHRAARRTVVLSTVMRPPPNGRRDAGHRRARMEELRGGMDGAGTGEGSRRGEEPAAGRAARGTTS